MASTPISGAVLIVEDPFVTGLLRSVLERKGFSVVSARAPHALEMLRAGEVHPDLLITNSPSAFAEIGDWMPLLYLSACPDPEQVSSFRTWLSLNKPFQPRDLVDAVGDLLSCGAVK